MEEWTTFGVHEAQMIGALLLTANRFTAVVAPLQHRTVGVEFVRMHAHAYSVHFPAQHLWRGWRLCVYLVLV